VESNIPEPFPVKGKIDIGAKGSVIQPAAVPNPVTTTRRGSYCYIYVWVHYYCTELPDMAVIYGDPA